jgi:hypothetical protein
VNAVRERRFPVMYSPEKPPFFTTRNKKDLMENEVRNEEQINKEVDQIHKETQPALYEHNPSAKAVFEQYEKTMQEYNDKIMQITNKIKDERPELIRYLEEMTVTIPDEKYPEVTIKRLQEYYESLIALLDKYILEHP